jgi:hypothetical protein
MPNMLGALYRILSFGFGRPSKRIELSLSVLPSDDIFGNKLELSRYDTMMQVWGRGRFTSTSGPGIG